MFARDFFSRFIEGHDVPDYQRLLARAGLVLRKMHPGQASWGRVQFDSRGGTIQFGAAPASDSPLYEAGLDVGDEIRQVDGNRVSSPDEMNGVLAGHHPGDVVTVAFVDRSGASKRASVKLVEDTRLEIVPIEFTLGGQLQTSQKSFRDGWLR